ncbi:MAG: glycosyltransferase family 4 protein [Chloroflexi bacterium]|nr:glycosyltransferase family 4 protein [Chloroflexota bacterium]
MKILFLRPRAELGGASRHMLALATALAERGHAVTLGTGGGEWRDQFAHPVSLPLYPSTARNLIASIGQTTQVTHREKIDVIHSHHRFTTIVGRAVARLTGLPLVCTVHEFKTDARWLSRLWIAPWVCAISDALRDHLIQFYGVNPACVTVTRIGALPTLPDPSAADRLRHALSDAPSGPILGYVGRLSPEKGVATLIYALPQVLQAHPTARVVIIGDGIERRVLETLATSLGLGDQVCFMGEQVDAPQLMTAMDVVVVPSLSEGFGLTAVEAMAAAKPVVASAVGGLVEVVEDGVTGFLVPPTDPVALSGRIIEVLANPARAVAMGAAGQKKVAEWTPAQAAEITEALYRRALANHA